MSAMVTCAVATALESALTTPAACQADRGILIVEDNDFVAHQCERALIEAGYAVVDIVTGADVAVTAALERQPQLVLMDVYLLGQRDGIDAAVEIFERCGIRSIFISTPADAVRKACADAARPLAWLAKPFNNKKLVETVASAMYTLRADSRSLLTLEG